MAVGPIATRSQPDFAEPGFTMPFILHAAWMPEAKRAPDMEQVHFGDELGRIDEQSDDLADVVREVARELDEGVLMT